MPPYELLILELKEKNWGDILKVHLELKRMEYKLLREIEHTNKSMQINLFSKKDVTTSYEDLSEKLKGQNARLALIKQCLLKTYYFYNKAHNYGNTNVSRSPRPTNSGWVR